MVRILCLYFRLWKCFSRHIIDDDATDDDDDSMVLVILSLLSDMDCHV